MALFLLFAFVIVIVAVLFSKINEIKLRLDLLEAKQKKPKAQAAKAKAEQATVATSIPEVKASEPKVVKPEPSKNVDAWKTNMILAQINKPTKAKQTAPVTKQKQAPRSADGSNNLIMRLLSMDYLVVKVGVVILLFGIGFLLKYAADHGMFSIEVRLICSAVGALAMIVVGWLWRKRQLNYALILQGGGIGILGLVVFMSYKMYHFLPSELAFVLLFLISILAAVLAILQDSKSLIILAEVGGYLAPILAAGDTGSYPALFSYYAILSLSTAVVAWFKSWNSLNIVSFVFTALIGVLWAVFVYDPVYYLTAQLFLVAFFLIYTLIAIAFSWRQAAKSKNMISNVMVFGVAFVGFGLQASFVASFHYGAAISSFVMGLFYVTLAWILMRFKTKLRLLVEAFFSLALIFATLAVPLALSSLWTLTVWAVEGVALIWLGIRQKRLMPRVFGIIIQMGAQVFWLFSIAAVSLDYDLNFTHILGSKTYFINTLVIAAALLTGAYMLTRKFASKREGEQVCAKILAITGVIWWYGFALLHFAVTQQFSYELIFFAITSLMFWEIGEYLPWQLLRHVGLSLLPLIMLASTWLMYQVNPQPLGIVRNLAWLLAFVSMYFMLYRLEKFDDKLKKPELLITLHGITCWLLTLRLTYVSYYLTSKALLMTDSWTACLIALVPAGILWLMCRKLSIWPFKQHRVMYRRVIGFPLLLYIVLWLFIANITAAGNVAPLPYIPLFNPLDIVMALAIGAIIQWSVLERAWLNSLDFRAGGRYFVLGLMLFVWTTAMILRTLHIWADIPFNYDAFFNSGLTQTTLSIFWTICGLILMLLAARLKRRIPWFAGVTLLGVVVIKLFLIDLANIGTIARIVSFMSIGLLLLIFGYFCPLPKNSVATKE